VYAAAVDRRRLGGFSGGVFPRACQISLSASERHRLKKLVRTQTAAQRDGLRARIVLLAARLMSSNRIAARLGGSLWTRCGSGGDATPLRALPGWPTGPGPVALRRSPLCGWPRSRRWPVSYPLSTGVPLSVWSCPELAQEARRGIAEALSPSTVRRWLGEDAIKPWQHQSWIFIRDPEFRAKASRVLDLYARVWDSLPLGPDEYVISSDEKISIQARCRTRKVTRRNTS